MKKSTYVIGALAVAVIVAAALFGNAKLKLKGSINDTAPRAIAGPLIPTCGSSWTSIFGGSITSDTNQSGTVQGLSSTRRFPNFNDLLSQGCSFKIVNNLTFSNDTHRDSESSECTLAYVSGNELTCYQKDFSFSSLLAGVKASEGKYYFIPKYGTQAGINGGHVEVFAKR